ncbi:MAG: Holliday junction resolvase RuvX [Clostridia bacterium]|nr:Holliday junction resolvase RuvX [Clostridia bacterium]
MKRYVALDIGAKNIGIAVSDPYNTYALPSSTYRRTRLSDDVREIAKILKDKGATCCVCGLPVNADGTESEQTEKTRRFIEELKKVTDVPVVLEDERFTTVMADGTLASEGMDSKKRRLYVDAVAAANILDGYLGAARGKEE